MLQTKTSPENFAAWILYGFSQEGKGIEKPAFFAVSRLIRDPPILPGEDWISLAASGPKHISRNLLHALHPLEGDPDDAWLQAMGRMPQDKLLSLARALDLSLQDEVEDDLMTRSA
jgi:hypothetical protein